MGIKKLIKKYKNYESKELARRATKRKRILVDKKDIIPVKKSKKLRLTARGITRAIGNPYGVKFPKVKKTLKKIKKKKITIVKK